MIVSRNASYRRVPTQGASDTVLVRQGTLSDAEDINSRKDNAVLKLHGMRGAEVSRSE